ncbi:hypothetical protein CsSME_00031295 [Camellia sinensis var. sinensis]
MAVSSTHAPVKVVYINTQYVETDQLSFKSVVQSLTGKNSAVASVEDSSFAAQKRKNCIGSGGKGDGVSILSKDLRTVDFDRLLFELPSMEDLKWLSSQ